MKSNSVLSFITFLTILLTSLNSLSIEVHGHRGSRGTHPENTLTGLQEAIEAGADVLEFDLGMSQDGVLLLSHDPQLNTKICRKNNGFPIKKPVIIYKTTYKKLQKYDCGSMINPRFPTQKTFFKTPMPSFEEALLFIKKKDKTGRIQINVETKIKDFEKGVTASPQKFATELARLIKKHDFISRTIVQSFDFRSLSEIRKIIPEVRISLLIWAQNWEETDIAIQKLNPNIISPPFRWLDQQKVNSIHSAKLKVIPWTLNEESEWKKAIQLKVDGIITDRPRKLRDFLKSSL